MDEHEDHEQSWRDEARAFANDLRRMADLIDKLERPRNQWSSHARATEESDRKHLRAMAHNILRALVNFWI